MESSSHAVKSRRLVLTAIIIAAALRCFGPEDVGAMQSRTLPPTVMEAFAAKPESRTIWSKFIAKLDGERAYAILSAVALESPTSTPRIMQGVRIELRHEGPKPDCGLRYLEWSILCERELATVYIEEASLEELRRAIGNVNGSAAVHPGHPAGVTYYRATSLSTNTTVSGLLLFGYTLRGHTLEEFSDLLAKAITELKNAPR